MVVPKSMSLWSKQGDHAGFMLISTEANSSSGTCVFILSPISVEGINSPLGVVISELRVDGEQRFEITHQPRGYALTIYPEKLPEILLVLNDKFEGEIHTTLDNKRMCIGTTEPLKKDDLAHERV